MTRSMVPEINLKPDLEVQALSTLFLQKAKDDNAL